MLSITPIPALEDNYLWLITVNKSNNAYIVDPGDGQVVAKVIDSKNLELTGILITHRHPDHTGGIEFLLERYQTKNHLIPVYGPSSPSIPQVTHTLFSNDTITLFDQYLATIIETPGHTEDHIAYFFKDIQPAPVLFCGDTLFGAGCGRISSDGNAEQLFQSLSKLASLPLNTNIYCSHEYTVSNLSFAEMVEPNNLKITERIEQEQIKRKQQRPTIPFTLEIEKQTNPFLRIHNPAIQSTIASRFDGIDHFSSLDTFKQLRQWKDLFNANSTNKDLYY